MAEYRIRVAKDKADLVKGLITSTQTTGPFQTYADAIAFAAILGAQRQKRVPLGEIARKEPAPISIDIFISRGYDLTLKLLAIAENNSLEVLATTEEETKEKSYRIFEEYANGGLEFLREELRGAIDYSERILLLLMSTRFEKETDLDDFDLSKLL